MVSRNRKGKLTLTLPNQKGFIMTEVLITMLLIVITMVAIMPMLAMGVKSGKVSKGRTIEMRLAQQEIERFNQDKFSNVVDLIKTSIANESTFNDFTSGTLPKYELSPLISCINPANGEIRECLTSGDRPQGFKRALVTRFYSYKGGHPTLLDDAIQYSVTVRIEGVTNAKPVTLSAILSRDKM